MTGHEEEILLSFILCSRNDDYMGSSCWRLQSALNYLARSAEQLGCQHRIEVIVADWGSDVPLRAVVDLSAGAARLTGFLEIPTSVAEVAGGDSPFPEVLALNCALRRCRGRFVARIDQDTLISPRWIRECMRLIDGDVVPPVAVEESVFFMRRKSIPYAIAARCPPLGELSDIVKVFGRVMPTEGRGSIPWFDAPVGVLLVSRRLWFECGGYDERLRYWGFMETDLALRLRTRYEVVDMGKLVGHHAFHLEHTTRWFDRTARRKNPRSMPVVFHPNTSKWGRAGRGAPLEHSVACEPAFDGWRHSTHRALSRLQIGFAVVQRNVQECIVVAARYLPRVARRHPSEIADTFRRPE